MPNPKLFLERSIQSLHRRILTPEELDLFSAVPPEQLKEFVGLQVELKPLSALNFLVKQQDKELVESAFISALKHMDLSSIKMWSILAIERLGHLKTIELVKQALPLKTDGVDGAILWVGAAIPLGLRSAEISFLDLLEEGSRQGYRNAINYKSNWVSFRNRTDI